MGTGSLQRHRASSAHLRPAGRPLPTLLLWLSVAIAIAIAACTPEPAAPRLVLLYMPCTVSLRFLSPYRPEVPYTPSFERLGEQGVVFERHQTESGISGVSFASILSGTQATRHGVFEHPTPIDDGVVLVGEAFASAGYETWFWADHVMASPDLGYGRGVAAQRTRWRPVATARSDQPGAFLQGDDPDFVALLERLAGDPEQRAFVMTNFTVTHGLYDIDAVEPYCRAFPRRCEAVPPGVLRRNHSLYGEHAFGWMYDFEATARRLGLDDAQRRQLVATIELLYAANIYELDGLLGGILDAIERAGLTDETLIAVTADHGEVLYRPNAPHAFTHGFALAPEVLQVPWLLSGPGLAPGRYPGVTRSIDVLPTLAGLAGVSLPGGSYDGIDLSPALRHDAAAPDLLAFSHTAVFSDASTRGPLRDHVAPEQMWVAVRAGDLVYKLIPDGERARMRVFDWSSEPLEAHDLSDPVDPTQRQLEAHLRAYKQELVEAYHRRTEEGIPGLPTSEQRRRLRSLGYIE